MNFELDFQIRQEQYKDLLKEAEEHRLAKGARAARKQQKLLSAEKKKVERSEGLKSLRELLEGSS